ncbi:MAG: lysophospholipid acyltransferase family protein [Alphaproteobacteria bacterium]
MKKLFKNKISSFILVRLLALYTKFVYFTTNWTIINKGNPEKVNMNITWHNRTILSMATKKLLFQKRLVNTLASPSKDGEFIANSMRALGVNVYLSSQESGTGSAGLRMLFKWLKGNEKIIIVIDGSRGPRYHMKKGPLFAVHKMGEDCYFYSVNTEKRKVLNSWDRMVIPKPFGRGVIIGEVVKVDKNKSIDEIKDELENKLIELAIKSDEYFGHSPIEKE